MIKETREERDKRIAKLEETTWAKQEAKKTKYVPVWVLQIDYGGGWQDETWSATRACAYGEAVTYRQNCIYPVRVFCRRIKREEVFPAV